VTDDVCFQMTETLPCCNNLSVLPCLTLSLSHLQGAMANERDYESVVMMRMRQAAERQKLIEQMQRDDDEEAARS